MLCEQPKTGEDGVLTEYLPAYCNYNPEFCTKSTGAFMVLHFKKNTYYLKPEITNIIQNAKERMQFSGKIETNPASSAYI